MRPEPEAATENRDDVLEKVADLVEIAGRMRPSTVVVAGGDRVEDLRLVESARDHGIIDRIVLVGHAARIAQAVEEVGISLGADDIIPAENDEAAAAATAELIKGGGIDIALKGNISTPVINRHMLPLAVRETVGLASIFDAAPIAEGRPMVLTDAGVTTVCSFGRMIDLVRNGVDVAQRVMGIARPRVAILSANEKPIPSLPSTWIGAELSRLHWPDAVVYGPLSFDLATDPRSVATKGLPKGAGADEVAGRADVLVCPGIDAANILYKAITAMIKYGEASLAGITVGFKVPYIILSRADALDTRLQSIALCSIYAQHGPQGESARTTPPPHTKTCRVLVINPGSTSMKIALFEEEHCLHEEEFPCDLAVFGGEAKRRAQAAQLAQQVRERFAAWGAPPLNAIAARGGFLPRPPGKLAGGVYAIEAPLVDAVLGHPEKDHASNYGIPVAAALAQELGVPAYTVDPVVVDEFAPEAEISGYAGIARRSTAHALSVRAAARRAAQAIRLPLEDINVVVAHLGGGITVAAVRGGKIVDNNIALLGGGPFTPQRAGQLPTEALIDLCYSGRFSRDALMQELTKRGGLRSYLGEDRMEIIEERIEHGDEEARQVIDAMIYQIAKEIGAMVVAAAGGIAAIVLTGGLVRSRRIRKELRRRVGHLAPVLVYEESLEMGALNAGAIAVAAGREEPRHCAPPGTHPAAGGYHE